ncbi:hypothetical protein [Streptomyces sp. NPDC090026]|uniref:hypothetical protein n=1 Tax=Streptomyces sp. NPDC090026 TaxID=3365923 RepID=UPI00381104F2
MTLIQPPLLTHGGTHEARAFRMMVRDLARGSQGITEADDLKVLPLATPGPGVRVADGSAIVRGAAWGQGSYTQYNVGHATVPIVPTGAIERSDLLVLRIEDPEYEGTLDPATDDIGTFHVVPNVSRNARTVPAGMTAIPLARIDIPANTAVITAAMVTDLRRVANPRRERTLHTAFPSSASRLPRKHDVFQNWPTQARWKVPVPSWATRMKVITTITGFRLSDGDVYGKMQNAVASLRGQDTAFDDDQGGAIRRTTMVLADNFAVASSLRGTTQDFYVQTSLSSKEPGNVTVDGASSLICDIEFTEGPV